MLPEAICSLMLPSNVHGFDGGSVRRARPRRSKSRRPEEEGARGPVVRITPRRALDPESRFGFPSPDRSTAVATARGTVAAAMPPTGSKADAAPRFVRAAQVAANPAMYPTQNGVPREETSEDGTDTTFSSIVSPPLSDQNAALAVRCRRIDQSRL